MNSYSTQKYVNALSAHRLIKLMNEKEMQVKDLHKWTGICPATFYIWLQGASHNKQGQIPNWNTLVRFCEVFSTPKRRLTPLYFDPSIPDALKVAPYFRANWAMIEATESFCAANKVQIFVEDGDKLYRNVKLPQFHVKPSLR